MNIVEHDMTIVKQLLKRFKLINNIQLQIRISKKFEGLSHTTNQTIFLNPTYFSEKSTKIRVKTIIHESVHIYQRMYPQLCDVLVVGYWRYIKIPKIYIPHRRFNPDLDDYDYIDSKTGKICAFILNDNAKSLQDGFKTCEYEHPYERMAYEIADWIVGDNMKIDKGLIEWSQFYL